MTEPRNLVLDVDERVATAAPSLRIAVGDAWAFTRHGGAPIVTRDCSSLAAFEREVDRLKAELDESLAAARERTGSQGSERPASSTAPEPVAQERDLPRLGASLRVRDVMTSDVRTMGPNDRLRVADELMKQGGFRHVVVVDDGRVVGVVSRRDIFHGALAWSLGQGRKAHESHLAASPAKDVMSSDVVSVDPDAPLSEAAALLRKHQVSCLPVVATDALVGILTEGDFLALIAAPA